MCRLLTLFRVWSAVAILLPLMASGIGCSKVSGDPDIGPAGDTSVGTECISSFECDDSDPCTSDQCDRGTCRNTRLVCDDQDLCTADSCVEGKCVFVRTEGCCMTNADCDDSDPCTPNDTCGPGNMCVVAEPIENCCRGDGDCDDGDLCTTDICQPNLLCFHRWEITTANAGVCCQNAVSDCADSDACTIDTCVMGQDGVHGRCAHEVICCDRDEDCVYEPSPCMAGVCGFEEGASRGECSYERVDGCCTAESECEDRLCHDKACDDGQCVWTPRPGCCVTDADCGDSCLVCVRGAASTGECELSGVSGCCQDVVLSERFDTLDGFTVAALNKAGYSALPSWNLSTSRSASAPSALFFGDPSTGRCRSDSGAKTGGRAVSDQIPLMLTKDPVLTFSMWKNTDDTLSSNDVVSVYVIHAGGEKRVYSTSASTVFNTGVPDGSGGMNFVFMDFPPTPVSLKEFADQWVRIVFEYDSGTSMSAPYEGVYIDDVRISGTCNASGN